MYPFLSALCRKTPLEQINAGNNSGYISEAVVSKMLSEQKNKQKGKWVDEIIETKKAFDALESRNKKTKGLDLDINVLIPIYKCFLITLKTQIKII